MKAMVIGGSGFMGSHTADELTRRGYEVTIYDQTESPWLQTNQKMIVGDYSKDSGLAKVMKGMSVLYHFAGIADIGQSREKPFDTIESNVMGLTKVLEAARTANLDRIMYASTMYVYSNEGSFYRASKQAAEIILEAYAEHFGIEFTLMRFGSIYGPRAQNWNGIRRFASQIVKEGKLDYSGDGTEMREYIHVHDAARLSVDILDPSFANRAITITGQQLLRVDELISILFEIAGRPRVVSYLGEDSAPSHYGHTPYRYTPKAAKKLVPQEFVDLGQGLLDIIEEIHHQEGSDDS
jgi:UDP-glucose 4-epimerase